MSFRSFGGEWTRQKKVSLAGRSRTEESSREEVLERTRQEREQRRQHKLETRSATTVQAVWRAWRSRQMLKAELRKRWLQQYGDAAQRATRWVACRSGGAAGPAAHPRYSCGGRPSVL